eukprot:TRINITY_DN1929_c0_g1_i1.p1 TRINITY_DN1929_c0_g1~~TRINITY_DN1929_c0_g1_i1.p1  ORF type:complete len:348 (+),score=71.65 TRINITY_DN1929_c0_g1_i1:52-1095(+)
MACSCSKATFALINLILLAAGLGLGGYVGIKTAVDVQAMHDFVFALPTNAWTAAIVIGVVCCAALFSIIGLLSVCCSSPCGLVCYFVLIILQFLWSLGGGITAFVIWSTAAPSATPVVFNLTYMIGRWCWAWMFYAFPLELTTTENNLGCCGYDGPNDLNPDATCVTATGCVDLVTDAARAQALIIGCVLVGIAALQLLNILFACTTRIMIKKQVQVVAYMSVPDAGQSINSYQGFATNVAVNSNTFVKPRESAPLMSQQQQQQYTTSASSDLYSKQYQQPQTQGLPRSGSGLVAADNATAPPIMPPRSTGSRSNFQSATASMFCAKCSTRLPPGQRVCFSCGTVQK